MPYVCSVKAVRASVTYHSPNGSCPTFLFLPHFDVCGRRDSLTVCALVSSGLGLSLGWGHCVVFLGRTLNSHSTSLHRGTSCYRNRRLAPVWWANWLVCRLNYLFRRNETQLGLESTEHQWHTPLSSCATFLFLPVFSTTFLNRRTAKWNLSSSWQYDITWLHTRAFKYNLNEPTLNVKKNVDFITFFRRNATYDALHSRFQSHVVYLSYHFSLYSTKNATVTIDDFEITLSWMITATRHLGIRRLALQSCQSFFPR